jgi:hypothetical protein
MNTAHAPHRTRGPRRKPRRPGRALLVAAGLGLATALLASACDTAPQVPWASYSSGLQPRIDAAAATGRCAALQVLLTAATNTSRAHEKATGFPNDALVSYIQAAQARANCPASTG